MKTTALHESHLKLGAKMAEFAGFDMPIQYSGIVDEHMAVRYGSGAFDVSHMGNIFISGKAAADFLDSVLTCDVKQIPVGKAMYCLLCYPDGGAVDDLIVYYLRPEKYMLIVNASNVDKDYQWLIDHNKVGALLENRSDQLSIIAVQGPKAVAIVDSLTNGALSKLENFSLTDNAKILGKEAIIARTGYTGEDGCEIVIDNSHAVELWDALLSKGVKPIGLGARDTLRLEMGYTLYGHEISAEINVLEAGLGWIVALDKAADYPGKSVLIKSKEGGLKRKLVGLLMVDKGIPRAGCDLFIGAEKIGVITSGGHSPLLNRGIALALVNYSSVKIDSMVEVDVRGRRMAAKIVKRKFL